MARQVHPRSAKHVAVAIGADVEFFRRALSGIARYIRNEGHWRVTALSSEPRLLEQLERRERSVDGILTHHSLHNAIARAIGDTPLVLVGASPASPENYSVNADNHAIGSMGAEHFLRLGFRRLAYAGVEELGASADRHAGFARAARGTDANVRRFDMADAFWVDEASRKRSYAELRSWLSALPKPVGVMAFSDRRATAVLNACMDNGHLVPEEVAVLGVDNDPVLAELAPVELSSIEPNAEQLGYKAAGVLDELLLGGGPTRSHSLPPRGVVVRRSTDVIAVEDPVARQALRLIHRKATAGLCVKSLCRSLDLSRRWLETRFRQAVGRTPAAEIRRVRIEHAKQLLAETDLEMGEIAERASFANGKTFGLVFTREVGMAPGAYRSRNAAEDFTRPVCPEGTRDPEAYAINRDDG